ncbi:MAG: hypothetical protein P1U47_05170 [Zhongshania sp.]|uniref:hypothetical protein n=1 Tax=Zhongshania sp. TaxID=1971902 RepID=UPI002617D158|nr:hypothetical protein [Zhongshania sp.]MDF1691738.1 hypothetical protein [Zhongshania sp.]
MSRRVKDTQTLDLFEVPRPAAQFPASMDYGVLVAHMVSDVLRNADCDRHEIAARMSRLTGKDVSKYMLDAWSSESRDAYNIPFYLVPVFETACSSHQLTNWLAGIRGGRLLIGREALNAELGRLEHAKAQAVQKIRDLKKMMGESE